MLYHGSGVGLTNQRVNTFFGGRNYLSFLPPGSDNNRFTQRGVTLNKIRAPLRRNDSKEEGLCEENEEEKDRQIRLISIARRWTTVVTIIVCILMLYEQFCVTNTSDHFLFYIFFTVDN